jgi:glycosyltransferase involved in cell wall biosynthesis
MLVSERADTRLRAAVDRGRRPCPEYLRLERDHGVELLDWSMLPGGGQGRSAGLSMRHAIHAVRRLEEFDVVFSDGEHVGVPLALAMRALRISVPHLVIGHHLTTRAKKPFFQVLRSQGGMTRIVVHSSRQLELAHTDLGIARDKLALVPYFADTDFWRPQPQAEEALVAAAGREHRDYATLARACDGLPVEVFVAAGSLHSPSAREDRPQAWPSNFKTEFTDHPTLRSVYARASVVVVPLVPTDFQAGVTTVLEAMAMGKAVIVTATEGQTDVFVDGQTAVAVPPGDERALRDAINRLLLDKDERRRLGDNARRAVERDFSLDVYTRRLAEHLSEIALPARRALSA